ncbi:MAG: hypothetical protein ACOCRK_11985 [bacterium]
MKDCKHYSNEKCTAKDLIIENGQCIMFNTEIDLRLKKAIKEMKFTKNKDIAKESWDNFIKRLCEDDE